MPADDASAVPLVVDLDGTLSMTDTLHEALLRIGAAHSSALPGLTARVSGPKAEFKRRVGDLVVIDGAELVYREEVLELVRAARAEGRRTVLASAADQRQVERVAAHLDLFDEAHGTGGAAGAGVNLSGAAKARFLTERFGPEGFDYVGDHAVDVPIWRAARRAITVGAGAGLRGAAEAVRADALHLAPPAAGSRRLRPYIKALRPHQWAKNVLIFLPILAAHQLTEATLLQGLLAFATFSLVASSVYVLNDLLDLAADRAHLRKCLRPFASGAVPLAHGAAMAAAPLLAGAVIALALGPAFLAVMAGYYALTFGYSLDLKRRAIVDICALAGLYTVRVVAGGVATGIMPSIWLLAFSVFLFFSLAGVKRQAELVMVLRRGDGRAAAGRGYGVEDLSVIATMSIASGYIAVLVMALYLDSAAVRQLYGQPAFLWGICGVLLYWVSRNVLLAHRGHMHDDPVVFALRDRNSLICGALIAVFAAAGSWA